MLMTAAECQRFIESRNAADIASCLRRDQELCRNGRIPSLLAVHLPSGSCPLTDAISLHLIPQDGLPRSVRSLHYEGIIRGIKGYLEQMDQIRKLEDREDGISSGSLTIPTTEEFQATLRVLDYLERNESISHITPSTPFTDIVTAVRSQLSLNSNLRCEYQSMSNGIGTHSHMQNRKCYICRLIVHMADSHDLYPSLCRPCGNFNLSRSELSLPGKLNLSGKTALVTGGRVNLGYHTALRLLRCGANVIVSSRYPRDAEVKYSQEHDFHLWDSRLRIVGADFRTAKDAFRLVVLVKQVVDEWRATMGTKSGRPSLDILINNAAQTLTDPVASEVKAVAKEERLQRQIKDSNLLVDDDEGYEPKVRGGIQAPWVAGIEAKVRMRIEDSSNVGNEQNQQAITKGLGIGDNEDKDGKSSWTQSLHEIPYEDMISAHSVNAFVPLILCRELLGYMGSTKKSPRTENVNGSTPRSTSTPTHPLGYVINVSSREGIFETSTKSRSKAGHHVHTNMSKAAINMITETEADRSWSSRRVAMNTVDPGYMSAAPEYQTEDGCPIGFEDGAARVLWPVAVGVQEGTPIWGRFLKHFGEADVEVGRGRG